MIVNKGLLQKEGGILWSTHSKCYERQKNWSQVTAAQQIGVSVDTWGNWERKRSFPDVLHIQRIQEVFNVVYDDIIFFVMSYG